MIKNLGIVGLVIALGIGMFFILYESKDTSDYSWELSLHPLKDQPYDISGFYQLIQRQYHDSKVIARYRDTLLTEVSSTGNLMIYVSNYLNDYQDDTIYSELIDWVSQGNTALIIADAMYIECSDPYFEIYTDYVSNDRVIHLEYCRTSVMSDSFIPHIPEGVSWHNLYQETFDGSDALFDTSGIERLMEIGDSALAMMSIPIDSGALILHSVPSLFSNYALQQPFFKRHIDYTLDLLPADPDVVILDHDIYAKFSDQASQSPIRFILSQPSLSWAYYLTLIAALLYLFLRGKRKQKPVSVIKPPENTSIQYAETLATLYASQDQNQDLIKHLEDLFYHQVKEKYFIHREDSDFTQKLARKSQFPINKIQAIQSHFSAIESKSTISDHQLGIIYGRLEDFHNHTI